ncbi:zinc finger protein rotund-like [Chrysoperla carnea]|uniref:zinc finger protein rotund-like n=1 Tax=Chrysoperla carnea TaxID=189513 RepID=UPI001D0804CC|nr:zinc finger protein rotund-like [Chrysoperla carnea]
MYPWYRTTDTSTAAAAMQASTAAALGQFCSPMATTIKTETGYADCMLAIDYATGQNKKSFVGWDSQQTSSPGPTQQCSQQNTDCTLASPGSVQCLGPGVNNTSGTTSSSGGNQASLAHWMSVMAEHMGHHVSDPTAAVGVHYMAAWSSNQDCGQHAKDEYTNWSTRNHMIKQGYEAKMSTDHHLQKGSTIDDISNHHHSANTTSLTNYTHTNHNHLSSNRSNSSSSSPISSQQNIGGGAGGGPNSGPGHGGQQNTTGGGGGGGGTGGGGGGGGGSGGGTTIGGAQSTNMHQSGVNFIGPSSSALLVVPQPINASKMGGGPGSGHSGVLGQTPGSGGVQRKYQCKMCPQVS